MFNLPTRPSPGRAFPVRGAFYTEVTMNEHWSPNDLAELRELYPHKSNAELAKHFNCSITRIGRAGKHHKMYKSPDHLKVIRALNAGHLPSVIQKARKIPVRKLTVKKHVGYTVTVHRLMG